MPLKIIVQQSDGRVIFDSTVKQIKNNILMNMLPESVLHLSDKAGWTIKFIYEQKKK